MKATALYLLSFVLVIAAGTAQTDVIAFDPEHVTSNDMAGTVTIYGQSVNIGEELCLELFWNEESAEPFSQVIVVQSSFFGIITYSRDFSLIYEDQ